MVTVRVVRGYETQTSQHSLKHRTKLVPEEHVEHALSEVTNLEWRACVSEMPMSKTVSSTEPLRRLKRNPAVILRSSSKDDSCSCVSDAMVETKTVTLTEPLRKLERKAHCRDYYESDGFIPASDCYRVR